MFVLQMLCSKRYLNTSSAKRNPKMMIYKGKQLQNLYKLRARIA
jgi:hypothetical protein